MVPGPRQLGPCAAAVLALLPFVEAADVSANETVGDRYSPFGGMGCGAARNGDGRWVFNAGSGTWPSCHMPVRGDGAYACVDNGIVDPTSIFVDLANVGDRTGCFAWQTSGCTFDLKRVHQITFDMDLRHCEGVWAAPLWLSPDPWVGPGQFSGEIDLVELCPRGSVATNFGSAGGPGEHQKIWGSAAGLNGAKTVTMTLDRWSGTLTTRVCNYGGSGCFNSAYYTNFLHVVHSAKGAHSFPYHLNVDVWNGHGGDGGWWGCGARNDPTSQCQFAVKQIRIHTNDGRPMFAGGKCAALNAASAVVDTEGTTPMNETIVVV